MLLLLREFEKVEFCAAAALYASIFGDLRLGGHLLEECCRMHGH